MPSKSISTLANRGRHKYARFDHFIKKNMIFREISTQGMKYNRYPTLIQATLLDIISCSCKAGLKPCLRAKCSCASAGLACTSYCFCKGSDRLCCNPLTLSQQEEPDDTNEGSGEDEDEVDEEDMIYSEV